MDILKCFRPFKVVIQRQIHTSSLNLTIKWRRNNGLPINKTLYGPLTDLPDYTFMDGRVTPVGSRQRSRLIRERETAEKIIKLNSQVDFAKQNYQDKLKLKEEELNAIMNRRLKSKGHLLLKKSK